MNTNLVKNKLNIVGKCYVKTNSVGGEVLSFIPDVPFSGYLDDFLFILTVPDKHQKFAPAYLRLQDKSKMKDYDKPTEEIKEFTEIKAVGYLKENKQKRGDIIICAPRKHVFVDFNKLVFIATIPDEDSNTAPAYFKKKMYEKNKAELGEKPTIIDDGVVECGSIPMDQIDEFIEDAVQT